MIDLYVTMPATEVEKLIQTAQIAENQVANGNAKNNPDFKYEEATMVIKLNGYVIYLYIIKYLCIILLIYIK